MDTKPKTLQQAMLHFASADNCQKFMIERRWPNGVECPTCGRKDVRYISTRRMWECKDKHPKRQFSVKIGTIFEDSPIKLDKWLIAIWMIANCKNGISSYEIGRALGVTQKSAWFMLHRIRLAMQARSLMKLGGKGSAVEVDETFIGGKSRFMHHDKRNRVVVNNRMRDRLQYSESWSAAERFAPMLCRLAVAKFFTPKLKRTSKRAARSTPTTSCPIRDSRGTITSIKLSTTPRNTLMDRFIPMASKTSGRFSSEA
jgi:hypothetical protein